MGKEYQANRSKQLGMAISTARSILFKSIIFDLAQKCGTTKCFRCGHDIATVDDLSVDHKDEWMYKDNPKDLYFDLSNIAFSHNKCNSLQRRCHHSVKSESGFKGVAEAKDGKRLKRYKAAIKRYKEPSVTIGYFDTPQEAAKAYDQKAVEVFGEKAVTNEMLGLL